MFLVSPQALPGGTRHQPSSPETTAAPVRAAQRNGSPPKGRQLDFGGGGDENVANQEDGNQEEEEEEGELAAIIGAGAEGERPARRSLPGIVAAAGLAAGVSRAMTPVFGQGRKAFAAATTVEAAATPTKGVGAAAALEQPDKELSPPKLVQ